MKSYRENPDSEENAKATKENEVYIKYLQKKEEFQRNCKHVYREDSTVCEICGS